MLNFVWNVIDMVEWSSHDSMLLSAFLPATLVCFRQVVSLLLCMNMFMRVPLMLSVLGCPIPESPLRGRSSKRASRWCSGGGHWSHFFERYRVNHRIDTDGYITKKMAPFQVEYFCLADRSVRVKCASDVYAAVLRKSSFLENSVKVRNLEFLLIKFIFT